jgi:thiamine biosynthesis lipoprotein
MKLDFGGIAKGYAIDQAYQVLATQGINHILVEGGGDLYVNNNPPFGEKWNILDYHGSTIAFNPPAAIASSGDSYKKLVWNGTRYSHIVNPDNGIGLPDSEVYTVIAENATIADALATTVGMITEKHQKKLLTKYRARLVK